MTTTKFIQLGERKNGRIVKNEQYTFEQLMSKTEAVLEAPPAYTWFDKMFKTQNYLDHIRQVGFNIGYARGQASVFAEMEILIDLDIKGKGSGRAKK